MDGKTDEFIGIDNEKLEQVLSGLDFHGFKKKWKKKNNKTCEEYEKILPTLEKKIDLDQINFGYHSKFTLLMKKISNKYQSKKDKERDEFAKKYCDPSDGKVAVIFSNDNVLQEIKTKMKNKFLEKEEEYDLINKGYKDVCAKMSEIIKELENYSYYCLPSDNKQCSEKDFTTPVDSSVLSNGLTKEHTDILHSGINDAIKDYNKTIEKYVIFIEKIGLRKDFIINNNREFHVKMTNISLKYFIENPYSNQNGSLAGNLEKYFVDLKKSLLNCKNDKSHYCYYDNKECINDNKKGIILKDTEFCDDVDDYISNHYKIESTRRYTKKNIRTDDAKSSKVFCIEYKVSKRYQDSKQQLKGKS